MAGIEEAVKTSVRNAPHMKELIQEVNSPENIESMTEFFKPLVSLVLYLCTANADIHNYKNPDLKPSYPKPKKTKKGSRYFSPDKPTEYRVGSVIGSAIRRYRSQQRVEIAERGPVQPHIRRAHFHTYLTGKGRTEILVKWLPPIPVNISDEELVPTVRRVK